MMSVNDITSYIFRFISTHHGRVIRIMNGLQNLAVYSDQNIILLHDES